MKMVLFAALALLGAVLIGAVMVIVLDDTGSDSATGASFPTDATDDTLLAVDYSQVMFDRLEPPAEPTQDATDSIHRMLTLLAQDTPIVEPDLRRLIGTAYRAGTIQHNFIEAWMQSPLLNPGSPRPESRGAVAKKLAAWCSQRLEAPAAATAGGTPFPVSAYELGRRMYSHSDHMDVRYAGLNLMLEAGAVYHKQHLTEKPQIRQALFDQLALMVQVISAWQPKVERVLDRPTSATADLIRLAQMDADPTFRAAAVRRLPLAIREAVYPQDRNRAAEALTAIQADPHPLVQAAAKWALAQTPDLQANPATDPAVDPALAP